jgi:hypothetical protein
MTQKQVLCSRVISVWDELCRHEPQIVSEAKALQYSFVVNKKKLLTFSLVDLRCMGIKVCSHFQKKDIKAEDAMADIGTWAFTECDDSILKRHINK